MGQGFLVCPVSASINRAKGLFLNRLSSVVYAVKKLLQVTLSLHVLEVTDTNDSALTPKQEQRGKPPSSFRPFGDVSLSYFLYVFICMAAFEFESPIKADNGSNIGWLRPQRRV